MKFYDREKELELLRNSEAQAEKAASFTVLMGRRRIGKTSLILKALEGKPFAYLFVSRDNEAMLCDKMQRELQNSLGINVFGRISRFRELFEVIMQASQTRHFTVVFDEIQNLYRINAALFSEMQEIWDRYHRSSHINLIACGSIHTLMKRIFENRAEPLYGRATSKFTLRPFDTSVLKEILGDHAPAYQPDDLLTLYMITGGVAKYVELLMDAGCFSRQEMLDYVCRQDSYFLTEGRDLVSNEFSNDYNTYFSILQLLASGMTRISEIDGVLGKSSGVYLANLENNYEMISKVRPLFSKVGSKVSKYAIRDHFLNFWFRFVYPYQNAIERNQLHLVREGMEEGYSQFSGRVLETYFQSKAMESGKYTEVGNWWDRSGENEVDLVAVNEQNHTGFIAEVKRNPRKISLPALAKKVEALPQATFGKYQFTLGGLSLDDM